MQPGPPTPAPAADAAAGPPAPALPPPAETAADEAAGEATLFALQRPQPAAALADNEATLFAADLQAPPAAAPADEDATLIPGRAVPALPPRRATDAEDADRTLFAAPAALGGLPRMPQPGAGPATKDADSQATQYAQATQYEQADAAAEDATLHMPAPGGLRTLLPHRPAAAPAAQGPQARAPRAGVELQRLVAGVNPLLGAASVLLALVARLRASSAHADPDGLRRQLLAHMADFEAQAAVAGVPRPRISAARYLLCSFLDEVIAATPWGLGTWEDRTLLGEFHEERLGGDKCFELLERLGQDPAANADVLELFYVCLALGFEGRYRGQPDGPARLAAIAERVLAEVRPAALQPPREARSLSLRWQGVSAPLQPGLRLPPLWSVALLAAALVLAALLGFQLRLAAQAQPLLRELHALPALLLGQRAPADAAVAAGPARLAPLLQADVAAGALAVRDERLRSVLTLPADALFKGGGAELQPHAPALLGRAAQALRSQPGQVAVIGHSDDAPAASLQYPSAWHLSRARAQAVLDELARQGVDAQRLHAEGRADAEPLAGGRSAQDRARNRRVEIELRLPRPQE